MTSHHTAGSRNRTLSKAFASRAVVGYSVLGLAALGEVACIPLRAYGAAVALLVLGIIGLGIADLFGLMSLAFPAFSLFAMGLSLGVVEAGAYISEQERYGFNIGATAPFCLYAMGFLAVAHGTLFTFARRVAPRGHVPSRVTLLGTISLISVVAGLAYAVIFLTSGTALTFASRFAWVASLPPASAKVSSLMLTFAFPAVSAFAGIYLGVFGWSHRLLVLIVPAACLFITGDKFTGFLSAFLYLLLGIGLGGYISGRRVRISPRGAVALLFAALLLAAVFVWGYIRLGADNILEAITTRIALQGHVWFGIFDRFHGAPSIPVAALVHENTKIDPSGLDLLSYYVADPIFVYKRLGQGVTFSMGGPPSALAAFGTWPGLLIYASLGILYSGAVLSALFFLPRRLEVFCLASVALYQSVNLATMMGRWDSLAGPVALSTYVVILAGVAFGLVEQKNPAQGARIRHRVYGALLPQRFRRQPRQPSEPVSPSSPKTDSQRMGASLGWSRDRERGNSRAAPR